MTERSHACHCSNEFCNADNTVKLLEPERDALKKDLEEAHIDAIRLQQEVNCLRMEPCQLPKCDALRERVKRLTTALEIIGNEAGSPTMDYEQKIENRELRSSRTRIYKMVRKALSIPEGER